MLFPGIVDNCLPAYAFKLRLNDCAGCIFPNCDEVSCDAVHLLFHRPLLNFNRSRLINICSSLYIIKDVIDFISPTGIHNYLGLTMLHRM